jgi:hypothetical protein
MPSISNTPPNCWRAGSTTSAHATSSASRSPIFHGRLIARMSVGNLVVDREVVTRNFPEGRGTVDVIAIYDVDGGRIARAWFKLGAPMLDKNR